MVAQQHYANAPITVWNKCTLVFLQKHKKGKNISFNLVTTCSPNLSKQLHKCILYDPDNLINISLCPASQKIKRFPLHVRIVSFGPIAQLYKMCVCVCVGSYLAQCGLR